MIAVIRGPTLSPSPPCAAFAADIIVLLQHQDINTMRTDRAREDILPNCASPSSSTPSEIRVMSNEMIVFEDCSPFRQQCMPYSLCTSARSSFKKSEGGDWS